MIACRVACRETRSETCRCVLLAVFVAVQGYKGVGIVCAALWRCRDSVLPDGRACVCSHVNAYCIALTVGAGRW